MATSGIFDKLKELGFKTCPEDFYGLIDTWKSWYDGDVKSFHHYKVWNGQKNLNCERYGVGMAKKVCEDWANLLMNEKVKITLEGETEQEFFDNVCRENSFEVKANELEELTFFGGTTAIVGRAVGNAAVIVPLIIAAFPFVARLVEGSLREVNPNIIEMSLSMGATTWQTVMHVMLPESVPSLITSFTTAITTILGYTAMSGAVGLGNLAITQGQQRYNQAVLLAALIVLVILVQVFQSVGTHLAAKADKRLKNK